MQGTYPRGQGIWAMVVPGLVLIVTHLAFATLSFAETQSERIASILSKADPDYGEYLAGQCLTCHHSEGESTGIPSIVGLPDVYFIQAMLDYKHAREERTNLAMVNIAKNLSDDELGSLAQYFSNQQAE